ncbi:hypothetical protein [Teichococcus wenyumeiae]|uniref:hypothetical protein n=1 Tax=Teichococcus wenyumeiae TaxID=2478470 RepID=UPI000EFBE6FD|nr:hypothetical protein [Pseudoroseomonas wenyumeiae]
MSEQEMEHDPCLLTFLAENMKLEFPPQAVQAATARSSATLIQVQCLDLGGGQPGQTIGSRMLSGKSKEAALVISHRGDAPGIHTGHYLPGGAHQAPSAGGSSFADERFWGDLGCFLLAP